MERLPQQCLKSVTLEAFTFEKINKSSDLYVVQIAAAKENEINMVHHPVFRTKFSLPLFSLDGNVLHSGHSEYDGIKLNETTKRAPCSAEYPWAGCIFGFIRIIQEKETTAQSGIGIYSISFLRSINNTRNRGQQ